MLRPQRMLKFRIIVPVEYELNLLDAVVSFGTVHMSSEVEDIIPTIPQLLKDVMEKKISYKELDIEATAEFVNKMLGPKNELSLEINRIKELYEKLLNLRNVPSVIFRSIHRSVETYLKDIKLPEWAFCSSHDFKRAIDIELDKLRKRAYELLIDVAEIFKAAITYEHIVRFELLEKLNEKYEEIYRNLPKIEEILLELLKLKLAQRIIEKGELDLLIKLNVAKNDIAYLLTREGWNKEGFLNTVKDIVQSNELLSALEKLAEKIELSLIDEKYSKSLEETFKNIRSIITLSLFIYKSEKLNNINLLVKILNEKDIINLINEINDIKVRKIKRVSIKGEKRYEKIKNLLDRCEEINKVINEGLRFDMSLGHKSMDKIITQYSNMLNEFVNLINEIASFEVFIKAALKVQRSLRELRILKDRRVCIAEGWLPKIYEKEFKNRVKSMIPKIIYFKLREVRSDEEAPSFITSRGFLGRLSAITLMRGIPGYWEIDPTPIFSLLFALMYGLMFGDIGLGIILTIFGLWLLKTGTPFLGISREGARDLGIVAFVNGLSSVVFGFLYGIAFLVSLYKPIFLSPLHNMEEMMGVALLFGVVQLILGMSINTINKLALHEYYEALLTGTGLLGIIYYIGGAYLAYHVIISGYDLGVMLSPNLIPVTSAVVGALLMVPLASCIKSKIKGEKEGIMEGVVEAMEMLIAYPANSLSYIRLAAFAMAHEIFGELAINMSTMMGTIPSYIFANILVLGIEGFVVGIQALRLIFYEFSTKFFKGEGIRYEPVLPSSLISLPTK